MTDRIAAGNAALERGAWREARAEFEAGLGERETPEALEGLGRACWWLDDVSAVLAARERAIELYPPFVAYRRRARERRIPVFRLEPASSAGSGRAP